MKALSTPYLDQFCIHSATPYKDEKLNEVKEKRGKKRKKRLELDWVRLARHLQRSLTPMEAETAQQGAIPRPNSG